MKSQALPMCLKSKSEIGTFSVCFCPKVLANWGNILEDMKKMLVTALTLNLVSLTLGYRDINVSFMSGRLYGILT